MNSILCGKVAVRKDGKGAHPWVTYWHGLKVGELRSRDYDQEWTTWEGALNCALAILKTWSHADAMEWLDGDAFIERYATPSFISPKLIEQEADRWSR